MSFERPLTKITTSCGNDPGNGRESVSRAGHADIHRVLGNTLVQAKLKISRPDDEYEREADRMADRVMQTPAASAVAPLPSSTPSIQRACMGCEQAGRRKDEDPVIRRKQSAGVAASHGESSTGALHIPGRALEPSTRTFMESRFNTDFSDVRIHAGADAAAQASALNARAFTLGRDIYFDANQYAPESANGRRLLAHELAHVMQARQGYLQRTAYSDCGGTRRTELEAAVARAGDELGRAITALSGNPVSEHARLALLLAFRSASEETRTRVIEGLQTIRSNLAGATFECENEEDFGYSLTCGDSLLFGEGINGYVVTVARYGTGNIHICMGTNEWGARTDNARTSVVIHEASHRFLDTVDEGYYDYERDLSDTQNTLGLGASALIRNADSYAAVVRHLLHGTVPALQARLADRSGSTLQLTQSPEGEIDLSEGRRANLDTFTIGIPREGFTEFPAGFSVRWMIADDADNRYQMYGLGGPTHHYGNEPLAYIPSRTRALLRERGIRRARVLCRVRIPQAVEHLFTYEVRFRY